MNLQKAIRLAIKALEFQQKRYHFDANMKDVHGYTYPEANLCSKKRQELREAISLLRLLGDKESPSTDPACTQTPVDLDLIAEVFHGS